MTHATRGLHNLKAGSARPGKPLAYDPLPFHRRLPGYEPTPLVALPRLADDLGLGSLWVKDESTRLGLPAFKVLGASWGAYRAVVARLQADVEPWRSVAELREKLAKFAPLELVAATDGNHGRAVARIAGWLGLRSHIFVPEQMSAPRVRAIEQEGAKVTVVSGSYDDAVALAASQEDVGRLVISDAAFGGDEEAPRWVMAGYSTIYREIESQLAELGAEAPDVAVVQIGVGALAASMVMHYKQKGRSQAPTLIGVEPLRAACALEAMEAGRIVTVPPPHDSIMAGLNCGQVSKVAWPLLTSGIDAFLAIDDEAAAYAMGMLAQEHIVAGESGAAGLAGLTSLLRDSQPQIRQLRADLGIGAASSALVLVTEGATDPEHYVQCVGATPEAVAEGRG